MITLITGPKASGRTTLANALAKACGRKAIVIDDSAQNHTVGAFKKDLEEHEDVILVGDIPVDSNLFGLVRLAKKRVERHIHIVAVTEEEP
jgi:adenylate kinase family enzyme